MPVITSIKPQKRNPKIFQVYLDEKFAFSLGAETLVSLGLAAGRVLKDDEVNKLVKEGQFQKVYDRVLRLIGIRPRSEKEIRGWFKKRKTNPAVQDLVLGRLKKKNLIDDREFARWWIDQRMQFRPRAKRAIANELAVKGIKKETREEVLAEAEVDERKIAQELLRKKVYKWKSLPQGEKGQKMSEFLTRKGFGWDVVREVVDEIIGKQ